MLVTNTNNSKLLFRSIVEAYTNSGEVFGFKDKPTSKL